MAEGMRCCAVFLPAHTERSKNATRDAHSNTDPSARSAVSIDTEKTREEEPRNIWKELQDSQSQLEMKLRRKNDDERSENATVWLQGEDEIAAQATRPYQDRLDTAQRKWDRNELSNKQWEDETANIYAELRKDFSYHTVWKKIDNVMDECKDFAIAKDSQNPHKLLAQLGSFERATVELKNATAHYKLYLKHQESWDAYFHGKLDPNEKFALWDRNAHAPTDQMSNAGH